MHKSEVRMLREQIEQEFVLMRSGFMNFAAGVSRHQFIETKMHRIGCYEDQLASYIGQEQASLFSCQTYIRVMEEKEAYC